MGHYFLKRILLIFPTLLGIITINFLIVQIVPGGPVEQMIAKMSGGDQSLSRLQGSGGDGDHLSQHFESGLAQGATSSIKYRGARGLDPKFIKEIEQLYGFDKPVLERYIHMLKGFLTFDFGKSYFKDQKVIDLIKSKLPVSISLGMWSMILIYLISIPLGIRKAMRDGTSFDMWTSTIVVIAYAIPGFLFAIMLIVFFAGGSFFQIFPLRGLTSDGFETFSFFQKIIDYLWHITLPVLSLTIAGFASSTLLIKNSFLEEIGKLYVLTAKAKGLCEKKVLWKHVFRNAILVVIANFPAKFMLFFFTGSILIEVIFSLDGLGLLGFEAAISRDYPVVFGSLFIFTLIGLVLHVLSDFLYTIVDPRIDFSKRGA